MREFKIPSLLPTTNKCIRFPKTPKEKSNLPDERIDSWLHSSCARANTSLFSDASEKIQKITIFLSKNLAI